MPPESLGNRKGNEPAAKRRGCAGAGVTGRPHARGIPWRSRRAGGEPPRLHCLPTGGGQKSRVDAWPVTTCPTIGRFYFRSSPISDGWPVAARTGEPGEASRSAGAFACSTAAPPRLHSLASPIRAHPLAGFAIMCRVRIFGGLFCEFTDGFREAMIYKGTMGTWEQAMSDRQKASPLEAASLFPSHRATLGTWEQKRPIPMQENPRACGHPVPRPAGELA